jgi:hypothetical protein
MSEALKPRNFPIMSATLLGSVPWDFIAPHEAQAQRNHGQSLQRLAERGGLNAAEAMSVVEGERYGRWPVREEAELPLINKVREWRAGTKP